MGEWRNNEGWCSSWKFVGSWIIVWCMTNELMNMENNSYLWYFVFTTNRSAMNWWRGSRLPAITVLILCQFLGIPGWTEVEAIIFPSSLKTRILNFCSVFRSWILLSLVWSFRRDGNYSAQAFCGLKGRGFNRPENCMVPNVHEFFWKVNERLEPCGFSHLNSFIWTLKESWWSFGTRKSA